MENINKIELQKIKLEPDEYLLVKINSNMFDIEEASNIYNTIKSAFPEGANIIGYPNPGVELQVVKLL